MSRAQIALRIAIVRTEEELSRLSAALGPDQCPCCVGAAYGGTTGRYDTLERKLDRQLAWLDVMLAKSGYGDLRKASAIYQNILSRHRGLGCCASERQARKAAAR